jgi:GAF domain-containing protein
MYALHSADYAPDAFEVRVSELLVATAEGGDALISSAVTEVLQLLREKLNMDVVFVSEFVDGHRVFRRVEADADKRVFEEGQSHPLEYTFCQRVVDGRLPQMVKHWSTDPATQGMPKLPFPIGSYLSVPVVLRDGSVYGTLCCFSFAENDALTQRDLRKLEMSAQFTARRIDEVRARDAAIAASSASSASPPPPRRDH